ncbi:MAG: HAMP domain-containing sensor histidine kinase [Spirochaetes bacterium]|nr:HAMP domain-containing sensor histidine kinase [Spirochaetota bacterium]
MYATIAVRDTGLGLSAEDRDRVFEEFYRVRSEQTHGITDTGLGLSLVKRLVEQHQGFIAVDSEPGKGSTFTVRLPVEGFRGAGGIPTPRRRPSRQRSLNVSSSRPACFRIDLKVPEGTSPGCIAT